jgi:hypothetical protein
MLANKKPAVEGPRAGENDVDGMSQNMPSLPICQDNIPQEIIALHQWVNWRAEKKDNGKITKIPICSRTGGRASHSNEKTWSSSRDALKAGGYSGIGYVFSQDDPYCGLDLDKCRDPKTGLIEPWAKKIIKDFQSYTEVAPSGTVVHILVRGLLPEGGRKKENVEIYDRLRFFCVTGQHLEGTPHNIRPAQDAINGLLSRHFKKEKVAQAPRPSSLPQANKSDSELIQKAINAGNGHKFNLLNQGLWEDAAEYSSQSEADQAFCNMLAFWTGADAVRMDAMFRQSGLMRSKWDKKHFGDGRTYGQGTIDNAISDCHETYTERRPPQATKTPPSELRNRISAPSMADLREYADLCVVPGQKITVDEICRGLACYKRDERKILYKNVTRLCSEGILKKDNYKHGGYRRVIEVESYDLGGAISEDDLNFNIVLPLELNLIDLKTDQLLQVSGRYDAGKSSFLFQIMADNYSDNKITLIVSEEWSLNAIKERMDVLGIPRPHENIKVVPMQVGYEDMIPPGRCIALIDYIRADQNPFETDAQIQRILKNLKGGVAIFATQKHPGLDRPVGGQFAVHASHHIVLLDKWRELFTCKIYRTKKDRNLEGVYKTFKLSDRKRLYPIMEDWKRGEIKWDHESKTNDGKDGKINAVKRGGPPVYKERKKERSKEKKKERNTPPVNIGDDNINASSPVDILFKIQKDSKPQGVTRNDFNQDREVLEL